MTIASVLAAFRIERGLDDNGKPIDPQPHYLPGVSRLIRNLRLRLLCPSTDLSNRFPAPFKATIQVRSQELADIIRSSEGRDL
jgi:hypothetical protein